MEKEFPKDFSYKILIISQEYVQLYIKKDSLFLSADSESEYYKKISSFFKGINPENIIIDDFDLFSE